MSDFPRAQKITALVVISLVVVTTLILVAVSSDGNDSDAVAVPTPDPLATPTAVPILARERMVWATLTDEVRGVEGTAPPVACPFIDERELESNNFLSLTPGLTFVCSERGLQAHPIAPGRVVMRVTQSPLNSQKADLIANGSDGPWIRAAAYGPFVVIDHGPLNGVSNVTSVYAGLDGIDTNLRIGQLVDQSTPLGSLGRRMINDELVNGVLTFELVTDDTRFGGDPLRQNPAPASASPGLAELVRDHISLPVTTCNVPFGNLNLVVGALREYRSGIHNGLDFNCGTTDHVVTASGDGQVLFVVNDYLDATVEDRDAVLAMTEQAFDTPFWTLAMLYGKFVVVSHDLAGDQRAVTVYAHLSEIESGILPGVLVTADTRLGTVGNTGTSASAEGISNNDGSVHLHWELHVDDRPIGYLESPSITEPLYEQILCTPLNPTTAAGC